MSSNHWTILFALFPIIGIAQTVTTFDSRTNGIPVVSQYRAVDIADLDANRNPDMRLWFRSYRAPALIDREARIGVPITGTVEQARTQLNASISNQLPAIARERDNDVREASRGVRSQSAVANSIPALRDQVARLAELVEQLQERIEQLERD